MRENNEKIICNLLTAIPLDFSYFVNKLMNGNVLEDPEIFISYYYWWKIQKSHLITN